MNFIVAWNEFIKSMNLLISALGMVTMVHTKIMSMITLFQARSLYGLVGSSCFSMCAIKMTSKTIPCVCRRVVLSLSLNLNEFSWNQSYQILE